ncbi:MAG: DUF4412 domain-containing protein [Candidatus Aminicenantes bacterium]|nr:MAG: DUF4412 domain-containing protein [Candidatus Aminicenantes bacterium]
MRSRTFRYFILTVLIGFVFGLAQAQADIFMKQKTHTGAFQVMGQSQPEKDEIMTFWIGENRVRTDMETAKTSSILLADKKLIIMIDHNKMQYSEMPLDFDKMFEEAAAAEAGDDPEKAEAMKKMPGFMKNMMKGVMGNMSAKVTETDETKKIGDYNCRKYLIEMNMGMGGETKSEAWATQDLKIDYTMAFTAANAMMASMPGFEKIVQEMKKVKGVVVLQTATIKMMGAEVTSTTELLEATEKSAPAGNYDIPAGYKKVKAMGR